MSVCKSVFCQTERYKVMKPIIFAAAYLLMSVNFQQLLYQRQQKLRQNIISDIYVCNCSYYYYYCSDLIIMAVITEIIYPVTHQSKSPLFE